MSSYQPAWSAPAWVKTTGCMIGLLPLPFTTVIVVLVNMWAVLALPFMLITFVICLSTLINGKPPKMPFRINLNLHRGQVDCDMRTSDAGRS
jgi:hypothetical protein